MYVAAQRTRTNDAAVMLRPPRRGECEAVRATSLKNPTKSRKNMNYAIIPIATSNQKTKTKRNVARAQIAVKRTQILWKALGRRELRRTC